MASGIMAAALTIGTVALIEGVKHVCGKYLERTGKMYKSTVKISGMMCGMCEAHICETIRRAFPEARKVKASRKRGEATFLCSEAPDADALRKVIAKTGYTATSFETLPYGKRNEKRI